MRFMFALFAFFIVAATSAEARCLREQSIPSSIQAGKSQERFFTFYRTGGRIEINTDSANDRLKFTVWRPDKRKPICNKGPDSLLICQPDVLTKASEGKYRIRVTNPMRRTVGYQMSCYDQ